MTERKTGEHPIAGDLVDRMKQFKAEKVVNLSSVMTGRAAAQELQKTVVNPQHLASCHLAHAAYAYAQNQMSVMVEQLTMLDEMAPFVKIITEAEEEYTPNGPPMSPLTLSYFTMWSFFDVCVGPTRETLADTVLQVGGTFGMHHELLRLIRLMRESSMGVFRHEGVNGELVALRELVTKEVVHAISPSGYRGREGELWYARVLPPPFPSVAEHVVLTTPYVLLKPSLAEWIAYWQRVLPDGPADVRADAYRQHMKYGPTPNYWNDFVFEGYVNHQHDAIFLAGLPDVEESRPHSRAYQS